MSPSMDRLRYPVRSWILTTGKSPDLDRVGDYSLNVDDLASKCEGHEAGKARDLNDLDRRLVLCFPHLSSNHELILDPGLESNWVVEGSDAAFPLLSISLVKRTVNLRGSITFDLKMRPEES